MTRSGIRIVVMVGLMLAVGTIPAHSEEEDFAAGPYLAVSGTWGIENFKNDGGSSHDGVGLDTRVGFRALRYLAAEVQWEYFPGFDTGRGSLSTHSLTGNLKGFLVNDNTGPFEPYAVVGVGALFSDLRSDQDSGFVVRYGGGMNMKFSDHVAFVAEGTYVQPTGNVDDFEYVSVVWGFQLTF